MVVTVLTLLTAIDLYRQMRGQMVEVAEQATSVAAGQLDAILTAAEELLRSTEEKLQEQPDFDRLWRRPDALRQTLTDIEETLHGTGFDGLAAIDKSGEVFAYAGENDLDGWNFADQTFMQRALDGEDDLLSEPITVDIADTAIAPLAHWVSSSKGEPLFLLATLIDMRFLQNFQARLQSSIIRHVALLDRSGAALVGSWPYDHDDPASVEISQGVGSFDLVAAAGFETSEVFKNVRSELTLLALTYMASICAVTALAFAYAYRTQVSEALGRIVEQKDVLHREAQHRVSGALQLISSLVALQATEAENDQVALALDTIKHRITAVLAVNDKLSNETDDQQVNLGDYLHAICNDLAASYEQQAPGAHLKASLPSLLCEGDKAIRLGLIVNELVTNAYRHAFPGGEDGSVAVELQAEGERYRIIVSDDGVGLPEQQTETGMGLELVSLLAEQLDCAIERRPADQGVRWRIEGPLAKLRANERA